ncbi:hypothetical protein K1719_026821 [Acacia pycnantha]|nr:hypothetical protein K1719_026821 [Acacia pycnantha]
MKNLWRFLSILLLCFSFHTIPSLAADSISANQTLSGHQTIISSGGVFELGFFKPGKSSNYYVGIWYKKISTVTQTTVWVANRDSPVSDKNLAKLVISNGNLVLFNESQIPVWSTNLNSTTSKSVVAVLLDSGNLVLRDKPESSENLWQSIDYPTDTWLPGGKIKLDNKTKKPQYLTSWKNSEDPAQGLFSLELDPKGTTAYFILWNKSEQYWTSGPWNGQIFSLVPEMRANFLYNFTFISNENESYFTYSMWNSSIISRFVMSISGQIQQQSWLESSKQWNLFWSQPRRQCEVYAFCGAFGSCNENSQPFCTCLTGYTPKSQTDWGLQDHSGGCVRKTKLQCESPRSTNSEKDRFLAMPNVALPKHAQSVGVGNAGECESTCLNNCSCAAYAYDSNGCSVWNGDLLSVQQLSQDDSNGETFYLKLAASELPDTKRKNGEVIGIVVGVVGGLGVLLAILLFVIIRRRRRIVGKGKSVDGSLMAFGYRDLQNATKNFSEKLGGGGFGSVFKGTLADSSVVAVKKLESISQGNRKLLVYDYMPNGSLNAHLFEEKNSKKLEWKLRYQIALGIARGLTYLHEKCRDCIIHCDIKPENILLDPDFCPKVADFGLAKLVGRDFSRVLTTMRGTRGRRNSEASEDGQVKFFPTWAANVVSQGDEESHRPSTGQIVQILEGVLDVNLPPIPRSLRVFVENQENIVFFTDSSSNQSSQTRSNPQQHLVKPKATPHRKLLVLMTKFLAL